MKLAETNYDNSETGCCARLDVDAWDGREVTWSDKLFVRDRVRAFLHIPLNYGSVMTRNLATIEEADAYPQDPMWLTDNCSPWRAEIFSAVDREVPGANIERLSGTFLAKVFEGPYRQAGKWLKDMQAYVREQGKNTDKVFFFYTTCPKCAKHFGKNYVVLLARVV